MSDCTLCPVEKRCDYEYKPCGCVHQRKFVQVVLKPFQVGENDLVLAKDAAQAKEVLIAHCGEPDWEEEFEVSDLSSNLGMKFKDEDGACLGTLGEWIVGMDEPQYLVGWE